MNITCHILRLFAILLLSVFGTNMAVAVPMNTSDITYFQTNIAHSNLADDVSNAARAPPLAVINVEVTGGVTVMYGSAFALRGQETHVASLRFGVGLDATNKGVPDDWKPISGAGAQVNTPKGFTSYVDPDGNIIHVSPGGLKYGYDKNFGNRVDHVLDHTAPNPTKSNHTVFNAQGDDALALVDEAWSKRGSALPNDPNAFVVNMGRPVGAAGETTIRVVVDPKTNNIITAYPQ